jgi:MFS family permease
MGNRAQTTGPPTYRLTIGSPAFVCVILAYGFNALFALAAVFWATPYALRVLHVAPTEAGFMLGGCGAVAGFLGMIVGGILSDRLRRNAPSGRVMMIILGIVLPPFIVAGYTTGQPIVLYGCYIGIQFFVSWGLGSAATITQDLVLPRMRGTATAIFLISTTLLAFTVGPYLAGRISTLSGSLSIGVLSLLAVVPVALATAISAYRLVPIAERDRETLAGSSY